MVPALLPYPPLRPHSGGVMVCAGGMHQVVEQLKLHVLRLSVGEWPHVMANCESNLILRALNLERPHGRLVCVGGVWCSCWCMVLVLVYGVGVSC